LDGAPLDRGAVMRETQEVGTKPKKGGRPRSDVEKVRSSIVIARDLHDAVEQIRAAEDRSRNNMTERLLRLGVETYQKQHAH
jgi:hypothetical protein